MSKNRMFNTRFWSDSWIVDDLNPLDRYLFIYLLTNERTNLCGVYELPMRTIANETGIEKEELTRMMKRLEPKVYYVAGHVVLVNALKHQNYNNSKLAIGIQKELTNIPNSAKQRLHIPSDFDNTFLNGSESLTDEISEKQDESSMSHTRPPVYLIKSNLIKSNLIQLKPAVAKATKRPDVIEKTVIDGMLELWETQIGYPVGNEAGNRKAIAALVRQHKAEGLAKLLRMVKLSHEDQYAPRISDFSSLKRKQNDLLVWAKKKASNSGSVEVIS